MAHDAACRRTLSRLPGMGEPDFSELEISSNADKSWSSSESSERRAEARRDSRDSLCTTFPRPMESTPAADLESSAESLLRAPLSPFQLSEPRSDIGTSRVRADKTRHRVSL